MEGILRQPDLAEIEHLFATSFNMDGQVVYFPVRHHSPVCALHLQRTINSFRPELILIEGPSDSAQLLPYIADGQSVPPFCIYYSYDDKEGKVSEEKEKYRAYYPFLSYSPELVAIREGARRNIPTRFIDLPLSLIHIFLTWVEYIFHLGQLHVSTKSQMYSTRVNRLEGRYVYSRNTYPYQ